MFCNLSDPCPGASTMTKTLTLALLAGAALLHAGSASAGNSWFDLLGVTDSGPLNGQTFSGSFAYDSSAAVAGFNGSLSLSAFSLQFAGQDYSLASADVAPAAVFGDGVFLGLAYADVDSSDSSLRSQLTLVPGFTAFDGEAYLAYVGAGAAGGFGSYSVIASVVPEPHSLALLLAGLGLVAAVARRSR
jgi:hypothetical protein